ncbi:MAG: hypothetical protein L0Z62_23980 [Gemmataceae bacterium]|nr:hypothetical protein [Gemmataceae bacterium]
MNLDAANVIGGLVLALAGFLAGVFAERRQYRLSASAFASDYLRDLRTWASEAIDVLSEAAYHAPGRTVPTPIDEDVCRSCRHRLSALVDRGRFFMPNFNPERTGKDKPGAFQGLRHPALDLLVAAEQILAGAPPPILKALPSQRSALVDVKRRFVSEIQALLDPRMQNRAIAKLLREAGAAAPGTKTALETLADGDHPDYSRAGQP